MLNLIPNLVYIDCDHQNGAKPCSPPGELAVTSPFRLGQGSTMLVGADAVSPVTPEYRPPFGLTGTGEYIEDYEAQMRIALAKQ